MLLGKRPRPPIRRTTSMTGITVDSTDAPDAHNPTHIISVSPQEPPPAAPVNPNYINSVSDQRLLSMLSPRKQKFSSANSTEAPHFLRSCGLCKRRLASGRDIYMYKGDTAFCSLECREQRMKQDARKEKMGVTAAKTEDHPQSTAKSNSSSKASSTNKSQPVAAA